MQNFLMKAYCKTWTPGPLRSLNTLNKKGPLTPAGSSPYCVLLEVVSEDIVIKFVSHIFCLQRKITLPLDQNLLSVEKQDMLFVWVLNFLCLLVFEFMKNPLRCASHPNFLDFSPISA